MTIRPASHAPFDLTCEIDRKLSRAAEAIEAHYGDAMPQPRRDLLVAFYLVGLTTPFFEERPPQAHLTAIRLHLLQVMGPERADVAIESDPGADDVPFSRLLGSIESLGQKAGHALYMRRGGIGHPDPVAASKGPRLPNAGWSEPLQDRSRRYSSTPKESERYSE